MKAHLYLLLPLATMRRASFCKRASDNWHAQTTLTFHPAARSSFFTSSSLRTFASNFSRQNTALLAGVVAYRQSECLCQKQPCTNTAVLYLGKTRSGLPGNFACSL